jgi:hypothetical protein
MTDEIDRRNLTEDEYWELSVELKVCFYLQGWNISADIHSVEDWLDTFGNWWDSSDEHDNGYKGDGKENARKEFDKLYKFVYDMINYYRTPYAGS